jgi:ParB family chromosome partitioning protein
MSKTAIDAKRGTVFHIEPERLTLITDKEHPLYDPRVENPADEAMIANIAMHGVIEPVIVRKNGDSIEVVAGRGRTKAALEANIRLIAEGKPPVLVPVILKGGSDADLFGISIAENEIRRGDDVLVKGEKARKLLNMGYTRQQIAVTFGVSRQSVDTWLAAEELPEPIKDAVKAGEVSPTAAMQLSGHSREEQVRRYDDIKQSGVKPTVAAMRSAAASPVNRPVPRSKSRGEIEEEITRRMKQGSTIENRFYVMALLWVLGRECEAKEDAF